jgi:hypothetical protein
METLQATGTVRGVFFSLGTTPATNDPKSAQIDVGNFVNHFQEFQGTSEGIARAAARL